MIESPESKEVRNLINRVLAQFTEDTDPATAASALMHVIALIGIVDEQDQDRWLKKFEIGMRLTWNALLEEMRRLEKDENE